MDRDQVRAWVKCYRKIKTSHFQGAKRSCRIPVRNRKTGDTVTFAISACINSVKGLNNWIAAGK